MRDVLRYGCRFLRRQVLKLLFTILRQRLISISLGGGFSYGPFAEQFDFQDVHVTEWKKGSIVEVILLYSYKF